MQDKDQLMFHLFQENNQLKEENQVLKSHLTVTSEKLKYY